MVALKTVSARIRGSKADLEELGEDVSDLAEGFSKYAKEIQALTGFNIMVEGTTDTFKDLYDIMDGISAVWDKLTDTQQARVSEILGGTRQLQVISSILGNWGDAVNAYTDAMNSANVATEANATYMDSAEAHIAQFKATFQEFAANTLNSDLIKFFIDLGTEAVKLADRLGGLQTILLGFATVKAFSIPGVGGAVGGIMAAITGIVAIISAIKHNREELAQANRDAAAAAASESDELAALTTEYTSINEQVVKSKEDKERLSEIESELLEKYGVEKREIGKLTEMYGDLGEAVRRVTIKELSERLGDLQQGIEQYRKDLTALGETMMGGTLQNTRLSVASAPIMDDADRETSYYATRGLRLMNLISGLDTESAGSKSIGAFTIDFGEINSVDQLVDAYRRLGDAMEWVGDTYGYNNTVYRELDTYYKELKPKVEAYTDALNDNNRVTVEKAAIEQLQGGSIASTREEFDLYRQSVIDSVNSSKSFIDNESDKIDKIEEVKEAVDSYLRTLNEFSVFYDDEEKSALPPSTKETSTKVDDLTKLSEVLSKLKSEYDILYKSADEMKDGGGLSADTIKSLSDATDDYLDYLYEENGVIKLNTESWQQFIDAQKQDTTDTIRHNIDILKRQRAELEAIRENLLYSTAPSGERDAQLEIINAQLGENAKQLSHNVSALDTYNAAMATVGQTAAETAKEIKEVVSASDAISKYTNSLTSLADLQKAVAESYTMSAREALKYAEVYPQILVQAKRTADGQIELNKDVVDAFITGSRAKLNASIDETIAQLEADKAVLESKKAFYEAQLEMVKQVSEGRGNAEYDTVKYILDLNNDLAQKLIAAGMDEANAYKVALAAMSGNFESLDDVIREVADNFQQNFDDAAYTAAQTIFNNMTNAANSVGMLGQAATNAAASIQGMLTGNTVEYEDPRLAAKSGEHVGVAKMRDAGSKFKGVSASYKAKSLSLDKYQSKLETEISGIFDAIGEIDGQIATLRTLRGAGINDFIVPDKTSTSGGSKSGGGSKSAADVAKEVQAVDEEVIKGYESLLNQYQRALQTTQDYLNRAIATDDIAGVQAHTQQIIDIYRDMQETVHEEAEYYRSLGYDETSDEIQKLSDLWWEYAEQIGTVTAEAYQALADNAKNALDEIKSAYDTLKAAAVEYAESGFITVDTLENIISMGVQYLAFLYDENGQLVINEENIRKIIAARTEQTAVETALAYVAKVREAAEAGDIDQVNRLTNATKFATDATWDLVYAQAALAKLSDEQYDGMIRNIQALQSLATSAAANIGEETGKLKQALLDEQNGLNQILNVTKQMIKQENQDQISAIKDASNAQVSALKDQKKAYDDQIDQKKKLLDLVEKQIDKEETLAGKIQKIAKLQAKINQLTLDDSREARAQRTKLEEELAELQKDLTDTQRGYEIEAQKEALDAEKEAYDNTMDAQISSAQSAADEQVKILQNALNSEEKLYRAAIARIDSGWDTLYDDLRSWNREYGSMIEDDLVSAWDKAASAVQRYGSYAAAATGVQNELDNMANSTVVGTTAGAYTTNQVNAAAIQGIMAQMRNNSSKWHNASQTERDRLHAENAQLVQNLSRYGVRAYYDGKTGKWYIESDTNNPSNAGKELYQVYHSGGVVGGSDVIRYDEAIAKLKKGEVVLTEGQGNAMYKIVDFMSILSDKIGRIVNVSSLGKMFGNTNSLTSMATSMMGRGLSALMGGGGNINVERLEVTAPIHVVQKLDDDDIREHARTIGSFAAEYIKEGFVKRGVAATATLF